MEDLPNRQAHPTHDEVLSLLTGVPGALGDLVRTYPGIHASDETDWLGTWFNERANKYFTGTISPADEIHTPAPPSPPAQAGSAAEPIRLIAVQPHFFRGFRDIPDPIPLADDLVVIDGRNTSGKTSLAEALEWLFTGRLSRRESMDLGSPHELENCVSNQFRPGDDETWVSGTLVSLVPGKTKHLALQRVLKEDYGVTTASTCASVLFLDGKELTHNEELDLLDRLFASEPPLLMQHTLRLFVQSNPRKRRQYFERLLHLDELTNLIAKAVIGVRLPEFRSPTQSAALKIWLELGSMAQADTSQETYRQTSRSEEPDLNALVANSLLTIAHQEFTELVSESVRLEEAGTVLVGEQTRYRRNLFPPLDQLRPRRQILDDEYERPYDEEQIADASTTVRQAWRDYRPIEEEARLIGSNRLAISRALKTLLDENVVQRDADTQTCPLCAYEKIKTLSSSRIKEIQSWIPAQDAVTTARTELQQAMRSLSDLVKNAIAEYEELLPPLPSGADFDQALEEAGEQVKEAVERLKKVREKDDAKLGETICQARDLLTRTPTIPESTEECDTYVDQCTHIIEGLRNLPSAARRYADALRTVEAAVGAAARGDPCYRLRAAWLGCFNNLAAITADLRWEQAKRRAEKDLESIREALLEYRKQFLESRRISFSQGIDSIWRALRADQYSSFSKLHIPPPSGKGFPVEIGIKALLDDGRQQKEVDALRVFSESQVNALGVAAFVTRSKLLGHKMLIFDDPVQSMDEEHFRTFAEDVLTHVLAEGFQTILLTHNDMFAADVSHCHFDRPGYVTMSVRLSRRDGCVVEEGNRRFSERLKLADKKIDDGELKRAWELVREAIERLYTVTYIKYGPATFKRDSWKDQSAEYMWNSGVGDILNEKVPGIGSKLKNILDMSAAGSHDKAPRGETDLRNSIKLLRTLPNTLQVGG